MGQGSDNFEDQALADKYETYREVRSASKKATRITKAAILREARRVYGKNVSAHVSRPQGRLWVIQVRDLTLREFTGSLLICAETRTAVHRMAMAALKAAGDAR